MFKITKYALVLCTVLAAAGCSDEPEPRKPKITDPTTAESLHRGRNSSQITILDTAGRPVANAKINIGTDPQMTADSSGSFVPPATWLDSQSLTISADGYVRTTYLEQKPTQSTYVIRAKAAAVKPELNGTTVGFGQLKKRWLRRCRGGYPRSETT